MDEAQGIPTVLKPGADSGNNHSRFMVDSKNARSVGECFQNVAKKTIAVDRRTTHIAGENLIRIHQGALSDRPRIGGHFSPPYGSGCAPWH
jgi:hypothetical protein